MRNKLRRFRMRYHAHGMTRYARDRSRHSESFEYVTFTRDSLNVQEVFTLMRDDANRGRRSARNVAAREDRRRQREIQDEMANCRRRQRAVTEHCRSSHRAAVRALHRVACYAIVRRQNDVPVRYSSCEQDRNAERRVFDFNLQERERFEAYLQDIIPRTNTELIYRNEIVAALVAPEILLPALQDQNARVPTLEKELRIAKQELSTQTDRTNQLELEVDVLVRRKQQRKAQTNALMTAKHTVEKQLAALKDDLLSAQHD
ncbi:hypothetical protein GN244_ATG05643 [Phytophthora infestans]|uniref:Uncharacterized protein n=1 Tax=Phytophthora infestans TaxID=4787 RepID=A0A833WHM0_PHYIN|nr:hypothetical protein GN244_ATG05643 [Phytophthora infestans]KAF4138020.1 hypothetical protein GN958_ATG12973 [Phytophthora infestans]